MLSFFAKLMICLLALIVGVLPVQITMASMTACAVPAPGQHHMMPNYDTANINHRSGHEVTQCSTCVGHPIGCNTGDCSVGGCGSGIGIPSATSNDAFNVVSLNRTDDLNQKPPHYALPQYRPPRA